ncbi:MAG: tRNA pseudouridine(38-40) synthase TruA [Thermoleophilia bacterium]
MVTIRLTLEDDGTGFAGWARQPGQRTVEGVLRDALGRTFGRVEELAVAGRTDAGVHATGQVVSLRVEGGPPPERAALALNALLPDDVAVLASAVAPDGFHARFSARARAYRYRVLTRPTPSALDRRRALWHPRPVDDADLAACAALLPGEHDFCAFTPTETQHEVFVRVVEAAAWTRTGDRLELTIAADGFLRHMVRTLVGTMLQGDAARLARLLEGAPRGAAGPTAPPWGLYLEHVRYDGEEPPAPPASIG